MCFSAEASFGSAAMIGTIGLYGVSLARPFPRWWLLASMPVAFSAHQALEGMLWLAPPDAMRYHWAALPWLGFAYAGLPVLVPAAMLAVAERRGSRAAIAVCLAIGVAVAIRNLLLIPGFDVARGDHVIYTPPSGIARVPWWSMAFYTIPTVLPAFLTGRPRLALSGLLMLAGLVVSMVSFHESAPSTWCFFAALASTVVVTDVRAVRER